jgi:hypothetical protein
MKTQITRIAPAGLIALVLCLWALPAAAQEDSAWMNCEICKHVMNDMDLLMACDYSIADWSQGAIFTLALKKPELMERFRALEEVDKKLSDQFIAMSADARKGKLCPHCEKYFEFCDRGLEDERIQTPTGTIIVTYTSDPALVKDVHAWTAASRKQMEEFDMSALAGMEKCDCGGTCPACAGKQPAAEVPEFMLEAMKNCYLCQPYVEHPEMFTAADCKIIKLKTGMAVVSTVKDRSMLEKYHAFEQAFHDRVDKLMQAGDFADAKKKVCMFCGQFCDLAHEGALMEWSNTDSGSMSVFLSDKPELVKKIHGLAMQMEALNNQAPKQETE